MNHWSQAANQQLGTAGISNMNIYLGAEPLEILSPIDSFYEALDRLLKAGNLTVLNDHPPLGPLIVIGIISATENYFRDVFSRILQICPTSRKKASDQVINFGSVLWHGSNGAERGALERMALSDPEKIIDISKRYIAFDIKQTHPLQQHLEEFGKICELRHCIVHSGEFIQGKNALALQLSNTGARLRVCIAFAQVQEVADVCAGMVRAFNTEFFSLLGHRWAIEWRKNPGWESAKENEIFKQVWQIFHSRTDKKRGTTPKNFGISKCRDAIRKEFGLI